MTAPARPDAWLATLRPFYRARPLVLLLSDLHGADPSSPVLLEFGLTSVSGWVPNWSMPV